MEVYFGSEAKVVVQLDLEVGSGFDRKKQGKRHSRWAKYYKIINSDFHEHIVMPAGSISRQ